MTIQLIFRLVELPGSFLWVRAWRSGDATPWNACWAREPEREKWSFSFH